MCIYTHIYTHTYICIYVYEDYVGLYTSSGEELETTIWLRAYELNERLLGGWDHIRIAVIQFLADVCSNILTTLP